MSAEEGKMAPDFTLPTDDGGKVTLSALKGRKVIVYFYPKDDTPGCTTEACDFRDAMAGFNEADAVVIGISKDSVARHEKFKAKHGFNFTLASDEDGKVIEAFGSWVEKKLYGRQYMGIDRSTFLIDKDGMIARIWRKVKVKGHVAEVLEAARAL